MNRLWWLSLPFDRSWWAYLFERPHNPFWCSWAERLWCRLRYHPAGPVFYNPGGLEPDNRCKTCGDYLA